MNASTTFSSFIAARVSPETAGGPAQMALSQIAAELGIYVVGGSLPELEGGRVYNTSYVYGRRGELLAKHRKVHLFDIETEQTILN